MLPLYEAKMIHHFDTRWATYEPDGSTRLMTEAEKAERVPPMPRYWVEQSEVDAKLAGRWDKHWLLGWRDICRATDERTLILTTLPRVPIGNKIPLALPSCSRPDARRLQMLGSSFVADYAGRQKLGSTTMNFFILMQLPFAAPTQIVGGLRFNRSAASWIDLCVVLLSGWVADEDRRQALRAELDAYCFHLYGCSRDEVDYIMETFPIVKKKDLAATGEFKTKEMVLRAYDAMADSIATGEQYSSPFEEVLT